MGAASLCPGTVHITTFCDDISIDHPHSAVLNTSDSTDIIEYTSLNIVQLPCQLLVNVSNDYINETINESFSKLT